MFGDKQEYAPRKKPLLQHILFHDSVIHIMCTTKNENNFVELIGCHGAEVNLTTIICWDIAIFKAFVFVVHILCA